MFEKWQIGMGTRVRMFAGRSFWALSRKRPALRENACWVDAVARSCGVGRCFRAAVATATQPTRHMGCG
jgi:hypothetical protein